MHADKIHRSDANKFVPPVQSELAQRLQGKQKLHNSGKLSPLMMRRARQKRARVLEEKQRQMQAQAHQEHETLEVQQLGQPSVAKGNPTVAPEQRGSALSPELAAKYADFLAGKVDFSNGPVQIGQRASKVRERNQETLQGKASSEGKVKQSKPSYPVVTRALILSPTDSSRESPGERDSRSKGDQSVEEEKNQTMVPVGRRAGTMTFACISDEDGNTWVGITVSLNDGYGLVTSINVTMQRSNGLVWDVNRPVFVPRQTVKFVTNSGSDADEGMEFQRFVSVIDAVVFAVKPLSLDASFYLIVDKEDGGLDIGCSFADLDELYE